ncbi:Flagellar motor rotation protein MotB [Actinomycetales bacterium JB111]|nr:Flagellar motor rotation protein MotB [Actinomycetales bacterium JB111]
MRLSRRRHGERSDSGENPYWISFSDLMSALLVIFVLAIAGLMMQLMRAQNDLEAERTLVREQEETVQEQRDRFAQQIGTLQEAEVVRAEMLTEIQDQLHEQGIEVQVSDDSTVLSIPTEVLGFEATSYEIAPEHRDVAVTVGETIAGVIESDERYTYLDTVFVEGHTDNVGFDGLEGTGNWGLSTFRAISLWRLWSDDLPAESRLDQFRSADGNPLFSVSGYGETRPATVAQETDADRAANRRIDIRFTVVRPTAEDLEAILESAEQDEA